MELRHLRYFVAVADEGHVTRAAEQLGIQQPPLSQQIKALETELGTLLFRRKPRGVELTEPGRALLADARAILAQVERARATTQRTARGEQGRIVVGLTSSSPFHPFVPRLIRSFRDQHPLVSLSLEETSSRDLIDGLASERIDAAFIRSSVADPSGVSVHSLIEEDMVAALPAAHALAPKGRDSQSPLPLRALAAETFIIDLRPVGPGISAMVIAACRAAGFTPHVGQEVPRIVSILNFVAAGLGIAIVPASLQRLHMDGVAYRRLAATLRLKAALNLAHRTSETSATIRRFLTHTRQMAKTFRDDHDASGY